MGLGTIIQIPDHHLMNFVFPVPIEDRSQFERRQVHGIIKLLL